MQFYHDLATAAPKLLSSGPLMWLEANGNRVEAKAGKSWPGARCCSSDKYNICDTLHKLLSSIATPSTLKKEERIGLRLLHIQATLWQHNPLRALTNRILRQADSAARRTQTEQAETYRAKKQKLLQEFKERYITPFEQGGIEDLEAFYATLEPGCKVALTKTQQMQLYNLAESKCDRTVCAKLLPYLKLRFSNLTDALSEVKKHRRGLPLTDYLINMLAIGFRHLSQKQLLSLPFWVIEALLEHPQLGATESELCDKLLSIGDALTPIFTQKPLDQRIQLHQMPYYDWRQIRENPLLKKWLSDWQRLDQMIKEHVCLDQPRGVLSAHKEEGDWLIEVQNPRGFLDLHESSYRHDPPTVKLHLPDDSFTFLLWRDEQVELRVAEGKTKSWNVQVDTTFFHYNIEKSDNFGAGWGEWKEEKGPWKVGRFVTHLSLPPYGRQTFFSNDFQKDWYWDHQEGSLPPTTIAFPQVREEFPDFARSYTTRFKLHDEIDYELFSDYEIDWYSALFSGQRLETKQWLMENWIVHDQKHEIDQKLHWDYQSLHLEASQYQHMDIVEF